MNILTQAIITDPVLIFFTVLVILVLAPLIFKKIKVPHIIGIILAGVIVGPYGLHLLDRDRSFEIFAQVGLLYLMFLAGIEIDMYNLRKNMKKGLIFSEQGREGFQTMRNAIMRMFEISTGAFKNLDKSKVITDKLKVITIEYFY